MAATTEKDGALATAAVAAAAGVAAYGLRKAFAGGSGESSHRSHGDDEENGGERGSLLPAIWESASTTLLPVAEDAADAAGKWMAENSPEVVRDRILPRFIEAFNEAA